MNLIKKAISLFQNIHIQSLLGNGVMAIFNMLALALLYRALSVNDIGVYVLFMTILGLIDTIKSGLLTNAFLKFYSGTGPERANEVVGSAWALGLLVTGVFLIVNLGAYFALPYFPNIGTKLLIQYFSLITLSTLPSFMANLAVQGEKRFDRLLVLRLINQVLFVSIIIVLILLKKTSLTNIILTYAFGNLIASLATLFWGWSKIGALKYANLKTIKDLFHFGKYSMGSSLSANLFRVVDIFFINYFLNPSALAMYNLGGRLLQFVEIPLLSFAASGMPVLAGFYNNNQKDQMMHFMKKLVGMMTIGITGIAIFSFVFANPIISLIGGEKYANSDAVNLFRIFMSMAILYPMDRFFSLTLDVINKPQVNFYKILIMLTANLIGDYIGILLLKSVFGIAWANLLPILIAIIISYVYLNRFYKFNIISILKVGFEESIILITQVYQSVFKKKAA
ncbi:MAG: polysaccharide biosynthesis protein [Chitinophagaceae bacterium BSSC1]|nr:MAG: polysaccharide biosynthesis protein [Chitinophagaceae bacterium BSSC1]